MSNSVACQDRASCARADLDANRFALLRRILSFLAGVVILKVTLSEVSKYGSYFPPDFNSDFLRGREGYFFGAYRWAFYTHILAGPVSLVLGLILVSNRFRARFPSWHRRLGWFEVATVTLLLAPSGVWLTFYAEAGPFMEAGLLAWAIATAVCATLGAWSALRRRFAHHRRWMWRCYLLLASAVVCLLISGLAMVVGLNAPWVDPVASWVSWLVPLTVFEVGEWSHVRSARRDDCRGTA